MIRKVNIMDEDWDYLIILDACRYDYFYKLYRKYLHGKLEMIISSGSTTVQWCNKSFQGKYDDVVYISANPIINSKVKIKGFSAKDHFHKVVDVWSYCWNEKLGTVHPEKVNQVTLNLKNTEFFSSKRLIIHYLQPHAPYIGQIHSRHGFPRPQIYSNRVLTGIDGDSHNRSTVEEILNRFAPILDGGTRFFIGNLSWKIRELLNLPPASPMDAVRRMAGNQGLREAYLENLRLVLECVNGLVENLSGKIVITSDHGELLGERGRYSHFAESSDPLLVEVPWLRVAKPRARVCLNARLERKIGEEKRETEFETEIRQRLKSLGYF